MTPLHSRVTSSKIQAVTAGRGLQPPASLRTEQVVNSAGRRDGQVLPPAAQAPTLRARFRGFNPKMSGGNSPQKSFSSAAAARRPKPKARRPLDEPLRRALLPTPAPPGAALRASGRGPGGRKEGRPRPRAASSGCWRRRRAPAISWPRPSGPAGARPAAGSSPGPTPLGPRGRMGRALDGPEPRSAPRLLSPNLTVSVASAKGRDGTGTARSPPPFPKGAPALSPQSHAALGRRKAANPGASSSGS